MMCSEDYCHLPFKIYIVTNHSATLDESNSMGGRVLLALLIDNWSLPSNLNKRWKTHRKLFQNVETLYSLLPSLKRGK